MRIQLLAIVLSIVLLSADGFAAPATGRPNIVLVMADDMGWSDPGCYGGEIPTPHIDALAAQGLRFTQFYNNAICGPTRASLLTGLYCQQVGHRGDRWNEPKDFSRCVTIGEVLQAAGYRTLMVGKWQGRDPALERGFDRFFGPMCQGKISYFHEVENNPFYLDARRWSFPESGFYMTEAFTDYAVEFLNEAARDDRPFFLYVAYIAPHWPLHAREADIAPHRERYRRHGWEHWRAARFERQREMGLIPEAWRLSPRPAQVPDWTNSPHKDWQAERMAVYAAQVAGVDRGVGRILDALENAGVEKNTLVMFLSDNGAAPDGGIAPTTSGFGFSPNARNDQWRRDGVPIRPGSGPENVPGPHDTFAAYGLAWANVSNTPLRDTKLTAWEGGIRTPLIARWPAVIDESGEFVGEVGHVIDIMPTCVELAGAEYPSEFNGRRPLPLEGRSLVPAFCGRNRAAREALCWSVPRGQAVALVGPSGAGKTSLLRLLAGQLAPATGTVSVGGRDLSLLRSRRELPTLVGLLPQQLDLVPQLSVKHNVQAGALGRWSALRSLGALVLPLEHPPARAAVARLGLADRFADRVADLSGGEQQRVALARALVQDAALVLADEPVASLDPARAEHLLVLLRSAARQDGRTLVTSLHDPTLARRS
ncbi:MAG: sulfatase-like hydrolase/transferase, partial [Planctomycetes bacterium]|nr:sulfatase-like hydrolase/transferase [Planctomycetota bacterium]